VVDGGTLELWKGIEVGHIFKLGIMYSETFGAYVQDQAGTSHPIIMGSYGIGLERGMAAIVESHHDEKGIIWPVSVAPYEALITVIRPDDEDTGVAAENLYRQLLDRGIDVLLDDRAERPGVKYADAELIGIPYRLTVGPKGVEERTVGLTERQGLAQSDVALDDAANIVSERVIAARRGV
jgi:prolyl-tRNA synthetase